MSEVESLRREVAELRAEIDRVDEWANGVFGVLSDVLLPLVRRDQSLAAVLGQQWQPVSERFDGVLTETGQADSFADTAERLEPRVLLFRQFARLGLWPVPKS